MSNKVSWKILLNFLGNQQWKITKIGQHLPKFSLCISNCTTHIRVRVADIKRLRAHSVDHYFELRYFQFRIDRNRSHSEKAKRIKPEPTTQCEAGVHRRNYRTGVLRHLQPDPTATPMSNQLPPSRGPPAHPDFPSTFATSVANKNTRPSY